MNWIELSNASQIATIKEKSGTTPQVIFKHSTRCSISSVAKSRLERTPAPPNVDFYFLDLISYRQLSAQVAESFAVYHESPQVLLIKNGECVYDESHSGISMDEIAAEVMRA